MVQKIKLMIIDLIRIKYRIKEIIMKKRLQNAKDVCLLEVVVQQVSAALLI